ncbi:MAG TPA: lipopolysaccharide biosynthesis protein [Bacteroidales bacterium]|nr:lipopolysaccharide biosynthesis protein [Bacteroidales bacterium]
MNLRAKGISGMVWSFLIQAGFQVVNFATSIILARILLPEEFGLIGLVTIFIVIGRVLVEGGLSTSLIRTKEPDQNDYSTVFFMNLAGAFIIYLVMFLLAPLIAQYFNQPSLVLLVRVLCLIFIINALSTVQSTRLNKNLQFRTQFKLLFPSLVISSSIGIWMAYNGYGVWSLVWKDLAFAAIATTQLWLYSKWKPAWVFNWEIFRYHFSFGYKLTITGITTAIFGSIYKFIIGRYFSVAELGFFTRAKSMEELPTSSLVAAFNRVAFPLLSQVNDDNERLKSVYKRLMIQVVFWIAPVLIIAGVLATPLFRFLLTEKWLPAVPYFQILLLAGLFFPMHQYNLNICNVKGRSDMVLKISLIQILLTIVGVLVAVRLGVFGLLWSIVIINFVTAILSGFLSGRLINYTLIEQFKDIAPAIIIGCLAGAFVFLVDSFLFMDSPDLIRLLFPAMGGAIIYLGVSYLYKSPAILEAQAVLKSKFQTTPDK